MLSSSIDLRELKKHGDVGSLIDIIKTGSIKEKREAAFILGELRSRIAVKSLIGLLKKDDVQIRANAAWSLGEIGNKDAVLPLIDMLNDISQIVQLHAAWALGRIGDKRAVPDLYAAMKSGSVEFRKVAKDAISRIEEGRETGGETSNEIPEQPLITLNIPSNFMFKYPSLNGESKHDGTIKITNGVIIEDSGDRKKQGGARKITVGLEDPEDVSVSMDILFRCHDCKTGETGSVWLQLSNSGYSSSGIVGIDKEIHKSNKFQETGKPEKNRDKTRIGNPGLENSDLNLQEISRRRKESDEKPGIVEEHKMPEKHGGRKKRDKSEEPVKGERLEEGEQYEQPEE